MHLFIIQQIYIRSFLCTLVHHEKDHPGPLPKGAHGP